MRKETQNLWVPQLFAIFSIEQRNGMDACYFVVFPYIPFVHFFNSTTIINQQELIK